MEESKNGWMINERGNGDGNRIAEMKVFLIIIIYLSSNLLKASSRRRRGR